MYHVQCCLQHDNSFQVSWIPERYAKKNHYITLKEDGFAVNWKVISVGAKKSSKDVISYERNYKKMRELTDI